MKVIVFGATGTVGRQLVDQALKEGHDVTAFARRPQSVRVDHPKLTVIGGDVLDPEAVDRAVAGHDAALVALGAGRKGTVRAEGTRTIIAGMKHHGVRRLIVLSTLGAGDSSGNLNFFWKRIMFGMLLREAFKDHQKQEALVRESGLDWTIVRPGALTDDPATGRFKHGFAPTERGLDLKISRADAAFFMLRQLAEATYIRATPGLSY